MNSKECKIEGLEILQYEKEEDFKREIEKYPYALLYYLSEVKLTECAKLVGEIDFSQLLEARFFGEQGELHIFRDEEQLRAVEVKETGKTDYIEKKVILGKNFQEAGRYLRVRKYVDYDEDGQAFIALTRLHRIEGGEMR